MQIGSWYNKKIIFANAPLSYEANGNPYDQYTHLQIVYGDPQTKDYKIEQSLPTLKDLIKCIIIAILLAFSLNIFATDFYITTSDLNLRSGAGKDYKSLVIISKGDTVQLIDKTGNYWVKIQYHDKIGYSSKQFLKKIQIQEVIKNEEIKKESKNYSYLILIGIILLIVIAVLLTRSGNEHRSKSLAEFVSLFFGSFGLQKFYLGQTNKGILSILFCWTFIPLLIGIIDFVELALMSKENFAIKYNGGIKRKAKRKAQKITTHQTSSIVKDEKKTKETSFAENITASSKEQSESKDFMTAALDLESKKFAIEEYPDDYSLQEYVYREQIESKSFMSKTTDKESKEYAIRKYPNDYSLQEYVYTEQVEAKSFMVKATDREIIEFVVKEYPTDYSMQKYLYEEQIALSPHERQVINNQTDETIIDVNSEELDLTVEQPVSPKENPLEPPIWSHSYVYSYDELNYATKAQRNFYFHFREKVLNNEFVDIQGNTNYAFILYFDLLDEYESHRDIKLLEEQFNILGQICPKTKSYSLHSLQEKLRKRSDSYSVDKLKDLEDPSYQFEYGYSDYNPDLYKLGNQYKEKLDLDKQEVKWLNKFYNFSNVFTSIEGCCIAIIKQYVFILKELDKQFRNKETTLLKEVAYFIEKLKNIYTDQYGSDWGFYDKSYISNKAESEVYLTIFKRIENSVRESFGHKRKISSDFPNTDIDIAEEFDLRLGNFLNELITKFKGNIEPPDFKTQIELNAQNVNRWKEDFSKLKNSFQKEEEIKFINGIIKLEETNKKNSNIENVFFEASKFIAKYDNAQSLKYYAKYIYYDLKSKKFDNKMLTKTVQKSLFKTNEQINDYKRIIAELIETSDIQKSLDEISKIYIPKRKKIKLDKTAIKEVEQKHDGTVELLNEYLEMETEETIQANSENEEIEISVIPNNTNNSIFISEISIGKIQEELVKKIVSNSFEILQNEVDKFATQNGMFKNQLIDSINVACEEHLEGEALIEEDEENYIIEESYYKEIAV